MKEAKVTCLCAQMRIPDLGLTLTQGQTVWLSEDKVQLSADLRYARQIRAVDLDWKERAQVSKPPPPPNFRKLVPRRPPNPVSTSTQNLDLDFLAKHVKAAVAGEVASQIEGLKDEVAALKDAVAQQVAEALANRGQSGIDPAVLAATLEAVLQKNMPSGAPAASQPRTSESVEATPLYIPTGIVSGETKGNVEVQESTADAGGADSAAAQLRALRKRKKEDT